MKLSVDSGFSNVFYGKKRKPGNQQKSTEISLKSTESFLNLKTPSVNDYHYRKTA